MKAILALLLIVAVSTKCTSSQDTPIHNFFCGFFEGIGEEGDFQDFKKCLGNMEDLEKEAYEAIKCILKFTHGDIIKGLILLGDVLVKLDQRVNKCLVGFPKLKELIESIRRFDIIKIVHNVVIKFNKLVHYGTLAYSCYEQQDFTCVGRNIGFIGVTIFADTLMPVAVGETTILAFVKGFLKGIGETKAPEPLIECIGELEPIIKEFRRGLELIKTGTLLNITEGVKIILSAVRSFLSKIRPCFNGYTVIMELMRQMQQYSIEEVVVKIIKNLIRIILSVDYAINGLVNNDYEAGGNGIGDILKFIYLS